jgi:hypothetical protein
MAILVKNAPLIENGMIPIVYVHANLALKIEMVSASILLKVIVQ